MARRWLIFLWLLCRLATAEIVLYEKRGEEVVPVRDYNQRVAALKQGDVIVFPGGERFTVEKKMNGRRANGDEAGRVTLVFSGTDSLTKKKLALRLPRNSDALTIDLLNENAEGYQPLRDAGVPIPSRIRHIRGQYTMVDLLDIEFTLEDLLAGKLPRDAERDAKLYAALVDFAEQTARYARIGDFGAEQVGWVNGRWVLFDWNKFHTPFERHEVAGTHVLLQTAEYWRRIPFGTRYAVIKRTQEWRCRFVAQAAN